MNYRFISNQLGLLLIVLSAILMGVSLWEAADWLWWGAPPEATEALLVSAGTGFLFGGMMWFAGLRGRHDRFGRREAMILVTASWLLGAALSALPFYIWAHVHPQITDTHPFTRFVDCYFEAMSGLTTTGATVLSDIDNMPRGLLLWRALTHWLGGLGIVVLFVAVLPTLGVGGKKIFHVETPGPTHAGVKPRIKETARILWTIYMALTAAQIVALLLCGMSLFDSICHTLATVATGGFSTRNASIGAPEYGLAVNIVVIVFMVLAGVNFGLYYHAMRGAFKSIWKDTELRLYMALFSGGSFIVVVSLLLAGDPLITTSGQPVAASVGAAAEHGVFAVASILTTTGFGTADFNVWPFMAQAILVGLMFIGGCAGSTGGGIKVVRLWIAAKILFSEVEKAFRPNVVRPTRLGKSVIDNDLKLAVLVYILGIVLLVGLGSILVQSFEGSECDYTTSSTASIACIFSIGPGLARVGAIENYAWMSVPSKLLLSIWMLLGRLEVFPVIVLFMPSFWRRN